jgi:hypothetical protein
LTTTMTSTEMLPQSSSSQGRQEKQE